ncbi:hypothetical protein GE107_19605 [Cohnella sp. CFH 77786]|uniref:hypothetical protein n=1 Tax=Cohnella sp. CFH 77786 TaxID=2662265 RepID=UPI001C609F80|nr:hypothetical protein [Cohnella sp. CFH 77786]MBW5448256.1 hypothetical protein [Cohnella sp. CFH 77786]
MTYAAMSKREFESLDDERLGWACAEPALVQIRGKDMSVKTRVIAGLNEEQRALCMFRVLYDHAKHSAGEYYAWVSYLQASPDYAAGVAGGLRFFGDDSMIALLDETRGFLEARNRRLGITWNDAAIPDLDRDPELAGAVDAFYARFLRCASGSLRRIAAYIRSHPEKFAVLES